MSIAQIITSEAGLSLVGAVFGGLWTLFKSLDFFNFLRRRRFNKALRILEAGVEETYRTYVRAIQGGRADGRLTDAERQRARELARDRAIRIARNEGVDLIRTLGEDFLNLWIAKLVNRLKRN
jgi:hypothetical protein